MPGKVNKDALEERLSVLARARDWPPEVLDAVRRAIETAEDHALFQMNPMSFAKAESLDSELGVELFLQATRAGLFRMQWSLLCRGCGELVESHGTLGDVEKEFFCESCARTRTSNLDEEVEVGFTVDPSVREIRYHAPEELPLDEYFFRHKFSRNIVVRDDGASLVDYVRRNLRALTSLDPGEAQTFEYPVSAGWVVGSPRMMITVEGEPVEQAQDLELVYANREFSPRPTVRPGQLRVTMRNDSDERIRVLSYFTPIVTYFDYLPFLSGQRLLNDAAFRRYLRTEVVRPGSGIPIKDNSLLFSDLRGSTELYDRIGDEEAFRLVSEHFECFARSITRCHGVIVKTMGDAVMASFNQPVDAVRAALRMRDDLAAMYRDTGGIRLQPKIGVHRGPCIVVNVSDRLDYFGHTVNVAARLQGHAGANEVCVSDAVWEDRDVAEVLEAYRELEPEYAQLKGVGEPTALYRIPAS